MNVASRPEVVLSPVINLVNKFYSEVAETATIYDSGIRSTTEYCSDKEELISERGNKASTAAKTLEDVEANTTTLSTETHDVFTGKDSKSYDSGCNTVVSTKEAVELLGMLKSNMKKGTGGLITNKNEDVLLSDKNKEKKMHNHNQDSDDKVSIASLYNSSCDGVMVQRVNNDNHKVKKSIVNKSISKSNPSVHNSILTSISSKIVNSINFTSNTSRTNNREDSDYHERTDSNNTGSNEDERDHNHSTNNAVGGFRNTGTVRMDNQGWDGDDSSGDDKSNGSSVDGDRIGGCKHAEIVDLTWMETSDEEEEDEGSSLELEYNDYSTGSAVPNHIRNNHLIMSESVQAKRKVLSSTNDNDTKLCSPKKIKVERTSPTIQATVTPDKTVDGTVKSSEEYQLQPTVKAGNSSSRITAGSEGTSTTQVGDPSHTNATHGTGLDTYDSATTSFRFETAHTTDSAVGPTAGESNQVSGKIKYGPSANSTVILLTLPNVVPSILVHIPAAGQETFKGREDGSTAVSSMGSVMSTPRDTTDSRLAPINAAPTAVSLSSYLSTVNASTDKDESSKLICTNSDPTKAPTDVPNVAYATIGYNDTTEIQDCSNLTSSTTASINAHTNTNSLDIESHRVLTSTIDIGKASNSTPSDSDNIPCNKPTEAWTPKR